MATKSLNKVMLIGNLGRDVEIKYTPQGTPVARLSLATNQRYKDKDGNWTDRVEWHTVVLWSRLAEVAGQYLKKGTRCYIEGRVQTRSWLDQKSNTKKYTTEIIGNDLLLLTERQGQPAPPTTEVDDNNPISDEDVPF